MALVMRGIPDTYTAVRRRERGLVRKRANDAQLEAAHGGFSLTEGQVKKIPYQCYKKITTHKSNEIHDRLVADGWIGVNLPDSKR
jgi:hypothetical protein